MGIGFNNYMGFKRVVPSTLTTSSPEKLSYTNFFGYSDTERNIKSGGAFNSYLNIQYPGFTPGEEVEPIHPSNFTSVNKRNNSESASKYFYVQTKNIKNEGSIDDWKQPLHSAGLNFPGRDTLIVLGQPKSYYFGGLPINNR